MKPGYGCYAQLPDFPYSGKDIFLIEKKKKFFV